MLNAAHGGGFWANWAVHDWLVLFYLVWLNVATWLNTGDPGFAGCAWRMGALLAFFLLAVAWVRSRRCSAGVFWPLTYRVAIQGTVQTSYFFFAAFLPLVNSGSLDQQLFAFDRRWFGFEASILLDRTINGFTSEWFAFFYFCYFLILALHSIPILLFSRRNRLLGEFALGMLILFCVGHILYTLVPGFGPVRAIAEQLPSRYPPGLWLDTVMATVASGGAQKDIFPSLHTAAPTFITLFSFRYRKSFPFRYSFWIVAVFAANIIVATMFLRWHWLVDVVAGLCLAVLGYTLAIKLTDRELRWRAERALSPSWPRLGR